MSALPGSTPPGAANFPGAASFPGATAVSHLRVYDWPAEDGRSGGSPHLHTVSAEGYVVLAGEGELETLGSHGFARTQLRRGRLVWFTPGTVHRLVNRSGDLEILVVMQNAGLPEAGDAVLTFPPGVLADPVRYAEAAAVPQPPPGEGPDDTGSPSARAARARRDLAVAGYLALREQVVAEGPAALASLYRAAAALVAPRVPHWRELWERGAAGAAARTGRQLAALSEEHPAHLHEAAVHTADPEPGARRFGMCGRLRVWDLDGAHVEGPREPAR